MRILDKYITKYFLLSFSYCLAIFIFLYIIIDLFGMLDEILRHGLSVFILQGYYTSMIPFIILQTSPVAALLSTIYVLGTMNKHGELTAMRAAGLNMYRIIAPFIFIGFAISILLLAISEKILPNTMKNAKDIKETYIDKTWEAKKLDKKTLYNIALYGKNNRLIFIDSIDTYNKIIRGVTILQQDKKDNVSSKTSAHEGKWIDNKWVFSNILVYRLNNNGMVVGNPVFFEEKTLDLESPNDLISKGADYEFMGFTGLRNYIKNFSSSSPKLMTRLMVDLNYKISMPFTSLVVILIGAGFAIRINQRSKATALMGAGLSILIGFIYYAIMATCIALGKSGMLEPFISTNLANIIFSLIGIALIKN